MVILKVHAPSVVRFESIADNVSELPVAEEAELSAEQLLLQRRARYAVRELTTSRKRIQRKGLG